MKALMPKVEKLFKALLQPEFQVKSEYYLSNLLSHLSGKENPDLGIALLKLPIVKTWVSRAVSHWQFSDKPSSALLSFTLNLTALLSKQESDFIDLKLNNTYERLFKLCELSHRNNSITPSMKLAYIKVINSCLDHRSGIDWVLATECWMHCLTISLATDTIYIVREGQEFIYKLLKATISVDEQIVHSIVDAILSRLQKALTKECATFVQVEDELLVANLRPIVKLLVRLQQLIIDDALFKCGDFRIPRIFISKNLENAISGIIILARNRDFLYELYNIIFHIYFFELYIKTTTEKFAQQDVTELKQKILNIMSSLINQSEIPNVVRLSHLGHERWNLLRDRLPPMEKRTNNRAPFNFQNELVIFQTLPIFSVCFVHYKFTYSDLENDDIRDDFFNKIVSMMSEPSLRLAYNWRNKVTSQVEAFDNGKLAIMLSLQSLPYFTKEGAIATFQILVYNANDLVKAINKNFISGETINKNVGYFIALLDAMGTFINKFDITWRDSVETICVTSCILELLKCNCLSPRVVVEALKLVKLSIARFLSPNLVLLVEIKDDTTMTALGTMICAKLYDIEWEVRDSALELVHTIANISNAKYPSYQGMLINMEIVQLTLTMSCSDSEAFVRASAIKCLQEMIQVKAIWTNILVNEDLPNKMIYILRNESEGIVRTQASALMRYIFEYQSFPSEQMDDIYEAMCAAVTKDLHWEVKTNALDFWAKVILNHLQDQGFIDGKFPTVTFSKENRKIVTLTDKEVKTRLQKVLHKLSLNGCLGAFVSAFNDDCDLEVVKKSLAKTKKVATILNMYNLKSDNFDEVAPTMAPISQQGRHNLSEATSTSSTFDFTDEILNAIVESDDLSLLQDVFNSKINTPSSNIDASTSKVIVTPKEYVDFVQQDLDQILQQKIIWRNNMNNIDSLVNDMLKSYLDHESGTNQFNNYMDCY